MLFQQEMVELLQLKKKRKVKNKVMSDVWSEQLDTFG